MSQEQEKKIIEVNFRVERGLGGAAKLKPEPPKSNTSQDSHPKKWSLSRFKRIQIDD